MPDEISGIASVVGEIRSLVELRHKTKREKRLELAAYFEEIRDCLNFAVEELRADRYPHGVCAELGEHARLMPHKLKGFVKEEEAQRLSDKLLAAHRLERAHAEIAGKPDKEKKLAKLEEAAGVLTAVAKYLRA
jgi:hypothetical protein